jgi:hypothetical protein
MKFLHKKYDNKFHANEYIFKHKKDYLLVDHSFKSLSEINLWRSIIYFGNNYHTMLKYGSKFALVKHFNNFNRDNLTIKISKDIFNFDYYWITY